MDTVFAVVGGGPSLRNFDCARLRRFRTIAVNQAYKLAPWAEIVFFGDNRWRDAFIGDLMHSYGGEVVTTVDPGKCRATRMALAGEQVSAIDKQTHLMGADSGTKAIHLAYHRGARRILLAGFDGGADASGRNNFHDEYTTHGMRPRPNDYTEVFPPAQKALLDGLRKRGVEVYRVTEPGLSEIPYRPDFLGESA